MQMEERIGPFNFDSSADFVLYKEKGMRYGVYGEERNTEQIRRFLVGGRSMARVSGDEIHAYSNARWRVYVCLSMVFRLFVRWHIVLQMHMLHDFSATRWARERVYR